jgi:porin
MHLFARRFSHLFLVASVGLTCSLTRAQNLQDESNNSQAPVPVSTAGTTTGTQLASKSDYNIMSQNYLLGDWGGGRARLEERGITFKFVYVSDFLGDFKAPAGKENRLSPWQRVRGTMDMDLGRLIGARGLTFHITGLWQNGVNMGQVIGSFANPSSLVSASTIRLDSFWFEQALFHDRVFLRGGQFAGQDFYGVQDLGGHYLLEPLGYAYGNLFSNVFLSYDPASGPAGEVRVNLTKSLYVKSAVFSGNRNPYVQDGSGFNFVKADSGSWASEIGYKTNQNRDRGAKSYAGSWKFGSIYNAGRFQTFATSPTLAKATTGNYLVYFQANQPVYRLEPGSNRGLDLTFGFDYSPSHVSTIFSQYTGGVIFNGPFTKRPGDSLNAGIVYSRVSNEFNSVNKALGGNALNDEEAFEFNYSLQVNKWLVFQPVIQYWWNLGGNNRQAAGIAGFRISASL